MKSAALRSERSLWSQSHSKLSVSPRPPRPILGTGVLGWQIRMPHRKPGFSARKYGNSLKRTE